MGLRDQDREFTLRLRPGVPEDIAALFDLEHQVFTTDRLSQKSLRNFLTSPNARLLVAERDGIFAGYALILFRPNSAVARLYSIAVVPTSAGRGIGRALLAAAEDAACARGCRTIRLEVEAHNTGAVRIYEKTGYRFRGRASGYYDNGGDALRFEKPLGGTAAVPPPSRAKIFM